MTASVKRKFPELFPAIESRVGSIEVLGIQSFLRNAQFFAETLEVYDFTFAQVADGIADLRVFDKAQDVLIGAACFLFSRHVFR